MWSVWVTPSCGQCGQKVLWAPQHSPECRTWLQSHTVPVLPRCDLPLSLRGAPCEGERGTTKPGSRLTARIPMPPTIHRTQAAGPLSRSTPPTDDRGGCHHPPSHSPTSLSARLQPTGRAASEGMHFLLVSQDAKSVSLFWAPSGSFSSLLYSGPHPHPFQGPPWMPETKDSTKPYIPYIHSYT